MDKLELVKAFFENKVLPTLRERFPEQVDDIVLVVGASVAMGVRDEFQDIDAELAICQPISRERLEEIKQVWQTVDCDIRGLDRGVVGRYPDSFSYLKFFDDPANPGLLMAGVKPFYILTTKPLYDPRNHYRRLQKKVKVWPDREEWRRLVLDRWNEISYLVKIEMTEAVRRKDAALYAQLFSRANILEFCIVLCRQPVPVPKWQHWWLNSCAPLGPKLYRLLEDHYATSRSLEDSMELFSKQWICLKDILREWTRGGSLEAPVSK